MNRRLMRLAALLASLLFACAAPAQFAPGTVRQPPKASVGTAPVNTYETFGYGAAGTGTSVPSASGTKSAGTLIGTNTAECSALTIHYNGSSLRPFIVDVYSAAGNLIENWYVNAGLYTGDQTFAVNVPAGTAISIRAQSNVTSQSMGMSITCRVRRAGEFAGFTKYEAINPDTPNTRVGTTEAILDNTWTAVATTARAYAGFQIVGGPAVTPGSNQFFSWELGSAEAGNVGFVGGTGTINTSLTRHPIYVTANVPKPSGTPIVVRALGGTVQTDAVRFGVMGFY